MARLHNVEHRTRSLGDGADVAVRSTADGPVFTGHAAVVNSRTAIGNPMTWGFYEELDAKAFDRTLSETNDVRMLVDHESAMVVARQSAGDLRLSMDKTGLATEADLDTEVSYIRDLSRNLEKRRITGMSFGFMVRKDRWETIDVESVDRATGKTSTAKADLRTILDLDLVEVSAVTFPAYEETDAALRAIASNPDIAKRRADMLSSSRVASAVTIGRCLDLMAELRAGKTLSQANVDILQGVLDRISEAERAADDLDVALESAQTDLSDLLGVTDPDVNDPPEDDAARSWRATASPAELSNTIGARYGLRTN